MTQSLWPEVALGDVASVTAGQSAPQDAKYFGGGNRFVRVSHLDQASHAVVGYDRLTDEAVKDFGLELYPAGTIIFPKSGASVRLEKRAVLPFDCHLVSHLAAVQGDPDVVDQSYLFYALCSHRFSEGKVEGYPTLKLSEIRAAKIPLPPLPEQRAIARVLRTVQRAKEATEQVISASRELKKSLMQHLFTYGRVPVSEVECVRLKETQFGLIPAKWSVRSLGELGQLKDGDWILKKYYKDSGVRLLQVGDVGTGAFLGKSDRWISAESARELGCTFVAPGQVLISRMPDPIGRACLAPSFPYPSITAVDVTMLDPDPNVVDAGFLVQALNSPGSLTQASRMAGGATRQRISRRNLEAVELPMPSRDEQARIAQDLRAIDRKIAAEEARRDVLATLFDSLLHDLMTARLRVTDLEVPV